MPDFPHHRVLSRARARACLLALVGALGLPNLAYAQMPVTSLLEMRHDRVVI